MLLERAASARHFASALIVCVHVLGCKSRDASENVTMAAPSSSAPPAPTERKAVESPAKQTVAVSPLPSSIEAAYDSFETYWPAFRAAVQSNDREKIASLTRFPFETRGDSDDGPTKKLRRDEFMQVFDSLLSDDPGLLMNGKETQRDHIARSSSLTMRQYASGDESARVGTFQFEKQDGRWWFTRAYVSED